MALYVEEDVDLVRTLEAVVYSEMLACLNHLVVLELVRVRLLACLPLTETYGRVDQESSRLQVGTTGSKVGSHCEKKMTGWLLTRCTRSSYSSTVVRRLARRARVHARPSFLEIGSDPVSSVISQHDDCIVVTDLTAWRTRLHLLASLAVRLSMAFLTNLKPLDQNSTQLKCFNLFHPAGW